MDKTLEIIMVAVTLLVAAVVVISLLQGQTETFSDEAEDQTEGASEGLAESRASIHCPNEDRVDEVIGDIDGLECSDVCDEPCS